MPAEIDRARGGAGRGPSRPRLRASRRPPPRARGTRLGRRRRPRRLDAASPLSLGPESGSVGRRQRRAELAGEGRHVPAIVVAGFVVGVERELQVGRRAADRPSGDLTLGVEAARRVLEHLARRDRSGRRRPDDPRRSGGGRPGPRRSPGRPGPAVRRGSWHIRAASGPRSRGPRPRLPTPRSRSPCGRVSRRSSASIPHPPLIPARMPAASRASRTRRTSAPPIPVDAHRVSRCPTTSGCAGSRNSARRWRPLRALPRHPIPWVRPTTTCVEFVPDINVARIVNGVGAAGSTDRPTATDSTDDGDADRALQALDQLGPRRLHPARSDDRVRPRPCR